MLPTIIAIIVVIVLILIWVIPTQRKLVVLDENAKNAMNQIGVQLSGQFDALSALLEITRSYDRHESEALIEAARSGRSLITAKSLSEDVLRQEGIIIQALDGIAMVTDKYPELKSDSTYIKTMDAVQTYENMLRTSRLIYNDSVTRLNRQIRMFPDSLVAGIFGIGQRDYLEDRKKAAD